MHVLLFPLPIGTQVWEEWVTRISTAGRYVSQLGALQGSSLVGSPAETTKTLPIPCCKQVDGLWPQVSCFHSSVSATKVGISFFIFRLLVFFFFYLLFLVLFFVVFLTPLTPGSLLCIPFVSPIRQPSGCQFEQQNYRILKFSLVFFFPNGLLSICEQHGHNSLSWLWRLWDKPDHQVCLSRAPKMPGAAAKPPLSISK